MDLRQYPVSSAGLEVVAFFIKCVGHSVAADARQVNPAVSIRALSPPDSLLGLKTNIRCVTPHEGILTAWIPRLRCDSSTWPS